ncbi:glycosyltransferase [Paenibacillus sp. N1-5-1-14]|uniref:glycosyltransferase n=1 Tax=Paenibacillus radicibacter TaxID=2972488 RepID=UPI002158C947|nr:glycosyltransferase family 2 protein [Paenibacillus radicibacter]MCR8643229.1 glycosyltransferase [Paenibacillus radicibacter]
MSILLAIAGGIGALIWGSIGLMFILNVHRIGVLNRTSYQIDDPAPPLVSVVIAGRNEQKAIERCIESLMDQTYRNLEIIVVNDRSTDATGTILTHMQTKYPLLQVITIDELPPDWLGKNNALYQGTLRTNGEWLLYTDADILFTPTCLEKALAYSIHNQLDHLTLIPEFSGTHLMSKLYASFIFLSASSFGMLWKVKESGTKQTLGVGAFNLLKRSVYDEVGTHAAIAMTTTDDARLGQLIKQANFRQDAIYGRDLVSVWNWYESTSQLIRSVEKSVFRFGNAIAATISCILLMIFPYVGLFVGTSLSRILCGIAVFSIITMYAVYARYAKSGMWYGIAHPLIACLLIIGALRGAILTSMRGGMTWRGTTYDTKNLKS